MKIRYPVFLFLAAGLLVLSFRLPSSGQIAGDSPMVNWTHFRGSNLDGKTSEKDFPVTWNDSTHIAWKTAIPGRGWSSPVVYGSQVWCTTAVFDGTELNAVCIDFNSGQILHTVNVFRPDSVHGIHSVNTHATPTPCIEEGYVYVHFGTNGTACLNTENGRMIWKRNDLNCNHVQGPGSSPFLYKEMLILHLEGVDVQFLVALDKRTGEIIWKTHRPQELMDPLLPIGKKAYITPIVINAGGRDLLISNGAAACIAYDVMTGKEVWRIVGGEDTTVAMPAESNGVIFFFTSNLTPREGDKEQKYVELIAANPNGEGDVTGSHVLWRIKLPPLQLSSPLVINGLLYVMDTRSNLLCIDTLTGEVVWSEKLTGKFNSSPVGADGNIYFSSVKGETIVIREGRKLETVARNKTDGEIWATPVFLRNSVLLRTSKYLYRIQ